jgi:hypothetical protein
MRIGAKITLNNEISIARDGLVGLADGGWLMNLPRDQDLYHGHPAGRARPALLTPVGRTGLVAVIFGSLPPLTGPTATLPVRWESLEPSEECAVLLDGDIALAPLPAHAGSILSLGGTCRLLPGALTEDGYKQARLQVIETARAFITSIALIVASSSGQGQQPMGPALSWLTGELQTP